jgi:D-3-phosphoglycerate dehydrogenase
MAPLPRDRVPAVLAGYDTCINDSCFMDADLLARCTGLRHIVFLGTGASSFIDVAAAERIGIKVSTIKGYGDTTVAEHTMALLFAAARRVANMDRAVRAGTWRQLEGIQLLGKTIGLVGLGGIGREVARLATGIGMNVVAWNRSAVANPPVPMAELDDLLAQSDFVSLHLALTDATRHFMDRARLSRMKSGAVLINTARAAVVDPAALVDLLNTGHIRHAGIDVFAPEPPLSDDPLLQIENVTLTAHAGYMTPEATMTMLRRAIDLAANG